LAGTKEKNNIFFCHERHLRLILSGGPNIFVVLEFSLCHN
jgi:hypothetical protein